MWFLLRSARTELFQVSRALLGICSRNGRPLSHDTGGEERIHIHC